MRHLRHLEGVMQPTYPRRNGDWVEYKVPGGTIGTCPVHEMDNSLASELMRVERERAMITAARGVTASSGPQTEAQLTRQLTAAGVTDPQQQIAYLVEARARGQIHDKP